MTDICPYDSKQIVLLGVISGPLRNRYHLGIKYAERVLREIFVKENGKGAWKAGRAMKPQFRLVTK